MNDCYRFFFYGGNGRNDDGKTKDGALSEDGSNTWKSRGGRDQERSWLRQITACAADRSCAPLRLARLSGLLLTPIPAPYHPSRRHRSASSPFPLAPNDSLGIPSTHILPSSVSYIPASSIARATAFPGIQIVSTRVLAPDYWATNSPDPPPPHAQDCRHQPRARGS